MQAARRLATRILSVVVRYSVPESQCWGQAMLRELDFVEGDWAALLWALGSTTALFRHSMPVKVREGLEKHFGSNTELTLKNIGKKTVALLSGMVIAGAILALCVSGLTRLPLVLFPGWQLEHTQLIECSVDIGVPEISYLVSAVVLWRRRRSIAEGILLGGLALSAHLIIHVAKHGWGG